VQMVRPIRSIQSRMDLPKGSRADAKIDRVGERQHSGGRVNALLVSALQSRTPRSCGRCRRRLPLAGAPLVRTARHGVLSNRRRQNGASQPIARRRVAGRINLRARLLVVTC